MNNLHRDREVIERARERVSPLELILTEQNVHGKYHFDSKLS